MFAMRMLWVIVFVYLCFGLLLEISGFIPKDISLVNYVFLFIFGVLFIILTLYLYYATDYHRKAKLQYPRLAVVEILRNRRHKTLFAGAVIILIVLIVSVGGRVLVGVPFVDKGGFLLLAFIMVGLAGDLLSIDYRIRKGFYGKNEREAREIIRFILSKRKHIDFTDDGKPKKIMSDTDLAEFVKTVKGKAPEFSVIEG